MDVFSVDKIDNRQNKIVIIKPETLFVQMLTCLMKLFLKFVPTHTFL